MDTSTPTIKGIFVKSHIDRIRKEKGEDGIRLLEEKYGKSLNIKNSDNVPIKDEVRLLECATEILATEPVPKEKIAFEAGRLHFRNFQTTPLAKILFPFFKNQFKLVMLQAENIAGHVFEGVEFKSYDLGDNAVKITLKNNNYPIEHFQGFFQEWMNYSGLNGKVEAGKTDELYEYTMKW